MKSVFTIGELLIDFMPDEHGKSLSDVSSFTKVAGGAPANVSVAVSKLQGKSFFLGQVGEDGFGHYLKNEIEQYGVHTNFLEFSRNYRTALAFVSLSKSGERDFIFYRDPSADQYYEANKFSLDLLHQSIFHFCSVSLISNYPIVDTHEKLIQEAKTRGAIISFDPNVRLALSHDHQRYQEVIQRYLHTADIIKISDDELEFITKEKSYQAQLKYLKQFGFTMIIITKGREGVTLIYQNQTIESKGYQVNTIDTTGAGDAWIGSFLYQLSKHDNIDHLKEDALKSYLNFSNAYAAMTTMKKGAMHAMPDLISTKKFMDENPK